MYLTKKNNFFHGIVFHHFHDSKNHMKSQGSISNDEFYKIIDFIGKKNILNSEDFFEKYHKGKIKENEVCLTFDDAIKCQIDVALPILEDLKIKSFFFVYTSMFEDKPDNLEIFRFFRTNCYKDINRFYKDFFKSLDKNFENFFIEKRDIINERKKRYPFYTHDDLKFRLVRDEYLREENYEKVMLDLMKKKNFVPEDNYKNLFFEKKDIIKLDKLGHSIGLHSHYHHTKKEKLSYQDQLEDYSKNKLFLSEILNKSSNYIQTASHPFGSYNQDTLKVLDNLGIKLAFKDSMLIEKEKKMKRINNSKFEIAREDHINILRRINL